VRSLPADALLTPSGAHFLRELETTASQRAAPAKSKPSTRPTPVTSQSSKPRSRRSHSPRINDLSCKSVTSGRRMLQRHTLDGNGGNIAIRVAEDIGPMHAHSGFKGFMKPEDMCLVDLENTQLCGAKNRTSEILMHLSRS